MYQTKVSGRGLYRAEAEGYGEPIRTFGRPEEGETPMSLVNLALASCVTMCVQGYFKRRHGETDLELEVASSYTDEVFELTLHLERELDAATREEVLAYIDQHCRVKQLFKSAITVRIAFA